MVTHFAYLATAVKELKEARSRSLVPEGRPGGVGAEATVLVSVDVPRRGDAVEADSASLSKKGARTETDESEITDKDGIKFATKDQAMAKVATVVSSRADEGRSGGSGSSNPRPFKPSMQLEEEIKGLVKGELQLKQKDIVALQTAVAKLEKQLRTKNAELEDRDFRLSLIENSSFDGTMVWKIPQFEQRMADAKSGKYTSIFSLPFYTGRYGYKMCLRLYILGDGIGKNTYMSLFFVIMRSEFDSILQWPFTHRVTFRLINQCGGRDIVETFQPDPASSSFRKPKSDMNIASGCPKFVSIQELNNGFIVEDTIYIRCTVDCSTIRKV